MEKELAASLLSALSKIPQIQHSERVDAGKYSYTYTPLHEILKVVNPIFFANDLFITQGIGSEGRDSYLFTRITHKNGAFLETKTYLPTDGVRDPKDVGKVITYFRRYALSALLNIATEEDNDATLSRDHQEPRRKSKRGKGEPDQPPRDSGVLNAYANEIYGATRWAIIQNSILEKYRISTLEELTDAQIKIVHQKIKQSEGKYDPFKPKEEEPNYA